MTNWRSMYEIFRDLSEAQGRDVPVDSLEALAADDQPPVPDIKEDTEEEFFKGYVWDNAETGIDVNTAPDLNLIQEMLSAVRLSNESNSKVEESIPQTSVIPQVNEAASIENVSGAIKRTKPKRRNRNTAIESILNRIGKEFDNVNIQSINSEVKTGDPNALDNSPSKNSPNNPDDVNKIPKVPSSAVLNFEPENMFRKKTTVKKATKEESKSPSEKSKNTEAYKPSALASEYYEKYVRKAKQLKEAKDDIWTKAEKKMKEIEAKRLSEAAPCGTGGHRSEINQCLHAIELPEHRHLLAEECIVCQVVSARGFQINKAEAYNVPPFLLKSITP